MVFSKDRVCVSLESTRPTLKNLVVQSGNVEGLNQPFGGDIRVRGAKVDLTNVTVRSGYATVGGGIHLDGSSTLEVVDSTIRSNHAEFEVGYVSHGGGIFSQGTLRVERSTLSGNGSDMGGGIYSEGDAELTNVTVGANEAGGYGGGGVANAGGKAKMQLSNVTIAYNNTSALFVGNGGGGISNTGGAVTVVRNSIIAENMDTHDNVASDCFGTFASDGYNLIGRYVDCSGFDNTGDLRGNNSNSTPSLPH